jgi:acid phosphatase
MNLLKLSLLAVPIFLSGCSSSNQPKSPDHIVIVIEENHGYDQIVDSPDAPYINALIEDGLLFTNSHGVTHPSQPNYIALFSGSLQGVTNDRCLDDETPYTTPNLGHTLIENGYTFAGYSETMPEEGYAGCGIGESEFHGSSLYARKHAPWVNWQGDSPTGLSTHTNKTLKQFPADFSKLPTVSFVIPNEDNDMHNGPDSLTIKRGDAWLKANLDEYIQWAENNNSLFILTFDEDDFTPKNRIPTIFVGEHIKAGQMDSTINHYHVLRTIEAFYELPATGPAEEKPIAGIWK